ncbi:MAG: BACON domain-containing protein [Bacteroidota bacterium]|nr:BACON domain-containing protein [Bacteroidota bacterium]
MGFCLLCGCEKEKVDSLSVSPVRIDFPQAGGDTTITIKTDADSWNISNPASGWLSLTSTTGKKSEEQVTLMATSTLAKRVDTLTISVGNAKPVQLIVSQSTYLYSLTSNVSSLSFKQAGNVGTLIITSDAPQWSISSDGDRRKPDPVFGFKGLFL